MTLLPRPARHVALAVIVACLAGCGALTRSEAPPADPAPPAAADAQRRVADFFWPYAALAANVYTTGGRWDARMDLLANSPWLRNEVQAAAERDPSIRRDFDDMMAKKRAGAAYANRVQRLCQGKGDVKAYTPGAAVRASEGRCEETGPAADEDADLYAPEPNPPPAAAGGMPSGPMSASDCEYRGDQDPPVPVEAALAEFGWTPVPELQRQLHPGSWKMFVPGLAVDVWRRRRDAVGLPGSPGGADTLPDVEYALVYRGTQGAGGWMSNLRAVTAVTPFVWDQYRQARRATLDLVQQIYDLHTLSDEVTRRKGSTTIRITAVGHSLGGGLANYVYLRVPQITRVVAFDPSPVDGTSMFTPLAGSPPGVPRRESVMASRRHAIDGDPLAPGAAIFVLNEHGEALSSLTGCVSGPIWGQEGGPVQACHSLNLSRGNPFRQHNMAQFACKLYLVRQGIPTR